MNLRVFFLGGLLSVILASSISSPLLAQYGDEPLFDRGGGGDPLLGGEIRSRQQQDRSYGQSRYRQNVSWGERVNWVGFVIPLVLGGVIGRVILLKSRKH